MSQDPEEYGPAHQPQRPSWECTACGDPWPCARAWEVLREQFPSGALGMFMVTMLTIAAGDMPAARPGILYLRFIELTGHRPPTQQQRGPGANGRW